MNCGEGYERNTAESCSGIEVTIITRVNRTEFESIMPGLNTLTFNSVAEQLLNGTSAHQMPLN